MKTLVIAIATGPYKEFLPGLIDSLKVETSMGELGVAIASDEEMDLGNEYPIKYLFQEDYPWPIVALMKFHIIKRAIELVSGEHYTHVCYVDSKVMFKENVEVPANHITTVYHNLYPGYPSKFYQSLIEFENLETKASIGKNYLYKQSGFFFGPIDLIFRAAKQISSWADYDLANHRIPVFHDESYWNKWLSMNEDLVVTFEKGIWGCPSDHECPYKTPALWIRDHHEISEERIYETYKEE